MNFGEDFEDESPPGVTSRIRVEESDDPDFVSGAIKKGLMWQQRDRIFSRWKERFFVLTKDYLQCFKKGSSRISEMGGFVFKIRLTEVIKRWGR